MTPTQTRIALDLSCLIAQPLTGVGYYTLNLTRALMDRAPEFDIRLFASSAQPIPDYLREMEGSAAKLITRRWPTRLKILMWTRFGWPPIERLTGDVDIAHGAFHLLPAAHRAARMVTVFDLSGLRLSDAHTAQSQSRHVRMLRHAIPRADALVAISKSCKTDLVELLGAPPEKVHIVYGGVSTDEFEDSLDVDALSRLRARFGIREPFFIHLGTLEPRKNLPRLLEAYARVRERRADCPQLVLAGAKGWMYEPIFETIARLRLADSVIHTGYLLREEAVLLLRGAFACVYPSLYEGFGLPVLEAMAAHLPVLTSNVSSLPEVVGDTAILVAPEDVDEIEAGLERLIVQREETLKQAEAGYRRAKTFTWEHSAAALAGVYRSIRAEAT